MKSVKSQIECSSAPTSGASAATSSSTSGRLLSGSLPAAAMTFGLFTFMYVAIGGYDVPEETEALPELTQITPQITKDRIVGPRSPKPKLIEASSPPPQLDPYQVSKVDMFIPTDRKIGGPPERIDPAKLMHADMIYTGRDTTAQPITRPNVVYPDSMVRRGIEGSCEVRFDLSALGEPFNIRPDCTHAGFERSAKKAVASSRFSPKLVQGTPVERRNVVYPIEYNLDQ